MLIRPILRAPDGDAPAGGSAESAKAVDPPKVEPKVEIDTKAIEERAAKALLAKFGVESEEDIAKILDAHKANEEAKLSAAEKQAKALKDSLRHADKIASEKAAAEAEAKAAKDELKAIKAALEVRDKLDAVGVAPSARVMAEALYNATKASEKDFKEEEFWAKTKKDHPSLFGSSSSAQGVSTAPKLQNGTVSPIAAAANKIIDDFEGIPGAARYARHPVQ